MTPPARRADRRDGADVPDGYDAGDFPSFAVTVDVVVLTLVGAELSVLLVRRGGPPFAGALALPGGFKRPDETLDEAAARELAEETGLVAPSHLAQFGAYGDPGRDPRTNVVTVAYYAAIPRVVEVRGGSDADEAAWWAVADALAGGEELAFDHHRLLADAVERVRVDLERTDLALAFLGERFTLAELRVVHEAVWGAALDPANFRRALSPGRGDYVRPTGERATSSDRGGRPAERFTAGPDWSRGSPVPRPTPSPR